MIPDFTGEHGLVGAVTAATIKRATRTSFEVTSTYTALNPATYRPKNTSALFLPAPRTHRPVSLGECHPDHQSQVRIQVIAGVLVHALPVSLRPLHLGQQIRRKERGLTQPVDGDVGILPSGVVIGRFSLRGEFRVVATEVAI